jgi:hypothetical protein
MMGAVSATGSADEVAYAVGDAGMLITMYRARFPIMQDFDLVTCCFGSVKSTEPYA